MSKIPEKIALEAIADPFRRLVAVMARLRGPGGCPWDREQNHQSLTPYLIEEAYEVKDTIDGNRLDDLCEELGDLILQVVFHAQLATEEQRFTIEDVCQGICDKLIRRHPHVFGDVEVSGSGDVLKNWEDIKKQEKATQAAGDDSVSSDDRAPGDKSTPPFRSMLAGVPPSLPALLKAHRIQQKVATVGFEWETIEPIWEKIHEEIDELREAVEALEASRQSPSSPPDETARKQMATEIGDLFFSIANLSRRLGVPGEEALDMTNRKFMARFRQIEQWLHEQGKGPSDLTLDELDTLWEKAKAFDL